MTWVCIQFLISFPQKTSPTTNTPSLPLYEKQQYIFRLCDNGFFFCAPPLTLCCLPVALCVFTHCMRLRHVCVSPVSDCFRPNTPITQFSQSSKLTEGHGL